MKTQLEAEGWCVVPVQASAPAELADEVLVLARSLGQIAPGRGRQLVEQIVPRTTGTAFAGSLSSTYGLGPLPLHTDCAHWPRPCRYLVMACADPGPRPSPTMLMDSRRMQISDAEEAACRQAEFLIRNGRQSFYASVRELGRPFIRLDRGCMTALAADGQMVLRAFESDRQHHALQRHGWKTGEILVINNWRMLHGRGDGTPTAPGRVLLRAMVQ